MTPTDKYFEQLDLPVGASPEQIRQAYRELVQIWHPDRYAHNPQLRARAEERIRTINAAYSALSQPLHEGALVARETQVGDLVTGKQTQQSDGGCLALVSFVLVSLGFLLFVRFFGWWTLLFFIPAFIWGIVQLIYRLGRHSATRGIHSDVASHSRSD